MISEKWDLELQAAVEKNEKKEELSDELRTGYDEQNKIWEVIVKYQGNLSEILQDYPELTFEELINGYGIIYIPEPQIIKISNLSQIEYFEKPKRIREYQNIGTTSVQGNCILSVKERSPFLSGRGVILAVIDSGINPLLKEFQTVNGRTRIVKYWDQDADRILGEDEINEMIKVQRNNPEKNITVPTDISGHGTAVTAIAAGTTLGIAEKAELLIVKLGRNKENGFGKTTDIMRGVTFALSYGIKAQKPVVINLSYGTELGPHRGDSLLERFLDNASEIWKSVICVGAGNEGDSDGHFGTRMDSDSELEIEFVIGRNEKDLILQGYFGYTDDLEISLVAPTNERYPINQEGGTLIRNKGTEVYGYRNSGTPYSGQRELYVELHSFTEGAQIETGLWKIMIKTGRIVDGRIDFYLQSGERETGFLLPDPNGTLTIPSTASKVITVGATDLSGNVYAPFSGRGFTEAAFGVYMNKPDLVAAGVLVPAIDVQGRNIAVTGTSFSTPVVAGMAVLLMEWGIVKGNDPFLYGQKCKARLIQGAKKVTGLGTIKYPNPLVGWGYACDIKP